MNISMLLCSDIKCKITKSIVLSDRSYKNIPRKINGMSDDNKVTLTSYNPKVIAIIYIVLRGKLYLH